MFVKIIYRHFVFNQEKYQVCKFRIYRHFVKSVNGSNFPVYVDVDVVAIEKHVPLRKSGRHFASTELHISNLELG